MECEQSERANEKIHKCLLRMVHSWCCLFTILGSAISALIPISILSACRHKKIPIPCQSGKENACHVNEPSSSQFHPVLSRTKCEPQSELTFGLALFCFAISNIPMQLRINNTANTQTAVLLWLSKCREKSIWLTQKQIALPFIQQFFLLFF